MKTLPIHVFKSSFDPIVDLLNEHNVIYQRREVRVGVPMASGEILEVLKAVGVATFWPAVAAVLIAFLNRRNGRKVIVTTENHTVLHVEGLSIEELAKVLQMAKNITAIDPNPISEAGSDTKTI